MMYHDMCMHEFKRWP